MPASKHSMSTYESILESSGTRELVLIQKQTAENKRNFPVPFAHVAARN